MSRTDALEILRAHAQTVAVCEACATTTRDLAAELKRGGVPRPEDLARTIEVAERALADLARTRQEVERLIAALQ